MDTFEKYYLNEKPLIIAGQWNNVINIVSPEFELSLIQKFIDKQIRGWGSRKSTKNKLKIAAFMILGFSMSVVVLGFFCLLLSRVHCSNVGFLMGVVFGMLNLVLYLKLIDIFETDIQFIYPTKEVCEKYRNKALKKFNLDK